MPQVVVDLEALVCGGGGSGGGGGDGKVVCETTLIDAGGGNKGEQKQQQQQQPQHPPSDDLDLPAESFHLPNEYVIDWVDHSGAASFYDRDDSTKGTTNPKSHTNTNANSNPHPNLYGSKSQRFSGNLKPKANIIGLPNLQHSGYLGRSVRKTGRHAKTGHIFPKKRPGQGKSAVPEWEPGSPKVSCFGKVLSEKERERDRCHRAPQQEEEKSGPGFWAGVVDAFSCCRGNRTVECVEDEDSPAGDRVPERKMMKLPDPAADAAVMAPPDLAGMKRFASGRRAASWCGDGDLEMEDWDEDVGRSGPLDRGGVLGRRSVGSLDDVDDWESVGRSSI